MPYKKGLRLVNTIHTPALSRVRAPGLLSLPNELLGEVVSYLRPSDTTRFMLVCRRLSAVAELNRYTSLIVGPRHGRALLLTLISGSPTANRYCELVRRVWYRGWTYERNPYESAALLSEMLPLLTRLVGLWVEVSPGDSPQLLRAMRRAGLVRESIHPAYSILDIATDSPCYSILTLPSLRSVKIVGDAALSCLTSYRVLEEVDLNVLLNHETLAGFLSSSVDTVFGANLKILTIRLTQTVSTALSFPMIASTFPNLERVNFEQTAVDFMAILDALATMPCLLDNMVDLAVNRAWVYPLSDGVSRASTATGRLIPPQERIKSSLERVFGVRPRLHSLALGHHLWLVGDFGDIRSRLTVAHDPSFWRKRFGKHIDGRYFSNWYLPLSFRYTEE